MKKIVFTILVPTTQETLPSPIQAQPANDD
jgi:hypothetical protein